MKQLNKEELKEIIVALTVENMKLRKSNEVLQKSVSMLSQEFDKAVVPNKLGSVGIEQ